MSLIVAKIEKTAIYIVADTKLSYQDADNHPEQKVASPADSVLKINIINVSIALAFAGDLEGVDDLLKFCRTVNDLNRILSELLKFHISVNGRTEFIVAVSHHPFYRIFEIKDLQKSESNSSWIGSKVAFSEFQRYLAEGQSVHPDMTLDFKMDEAFRKVMESSVDQSVNGFLIKVNNENGHFDYGSRIQISIVPQTVGPGFTAIGHGSVQKGGYSVHFFPTNHSYTVLPIHILQGNFGVIYSAKNGGLLWPEVLKDVDEEKFATITKSRYGISPMGRTPSLNMLGF